MDNQTIDEIVKFINDKIDIPYIPESVEALLIKAVITALFHILSEKVLREAFQKE